MLLLIMARVGYQPVNNNIQIHRMLLLITEATQAILDQVKFKYIVCCY